MLTSKWNNITDYVRETSLLSFRKERLLANRYNRVTLLRGATVA